MNCQFDLGFGQKLYDILLSFSVSITLFECRESTIRNRSPPNTSRSSPRSASRRQS
jgi:hypothetical protein